MWNSLAVHWLGLRALTADGLGSTAGQGAKIPQAAWHGPQKTKTKTKTRDWFKMAEQKDVLLLPLESTGITTNC